MDRGQVLECDCERTAQKQKSRVVMRKQRGEIKGGEKFQSGLWGNRKSRTEKFPLDLTNMECL